MKIAYLLLLSVFCIGCANSRFERYKPDHVAVKTGIEWQIYEDGETIHKPKVEAICDWNL